MYSPDTARTPAPTTCTSEVVSVTSVFTLHPCEDSAATAAAQQRLMSMLQTQGHTVLEQRPGFLGSELGCSADGQRIVHHARWANEQALAQMLGDDEARAGMQATKQLATVQVTRTHAHYYFAPGPSIG